MSRQFQYWQNIWLRSRIFDFMMKLLFAIAGSLFLITATKAQQNYEPTVLFLYPNQINVPDSLIKEMNEFEQEVEITDEIRKNYVKEDLPANWKQ